MTLDKDAIKWLLNSVIYCCSSHLLVWLNAIKNVIQYNSLQMVFGELSVWHRGHNRKSFSASVIGFMKWIDVYSLLQ